MAIHQMKFTEMAVPGANAGWKLAIAEMETDATIVEADTIAFMSVGTGDIIIMGMSSIDGHPVSFGTAIQHYTRFSGGIPFASGGSAEHWYTTYCQQEAGGTAYGIKGLIAVRNR